MFKANSLRLLLLLAAASYIYIIYLIVAIPHPIDYQKFYQSAQDFFQGHSLYSETIIDCIDRESNPSTLSKNVRAPNLNPPFFTLLVIPFAKLSYSHALGLWLSFSLLALLISMQWLRKAYDLSATSATLVLLGLLNYFPVLLNILTGQVGLWLLLLTAGGWLALRKQADGWAGILFGLLINIKIFFGIFLVFFLAARQWRALSGMIITAIACALFALLLFGTNVYWEYAMVLKRIYWYSSNWNGSILGWLVRIFGGYEQNTPFWNYPIVTSMLFYAFTAGVIGLIIKLLWSNKNLEQTQTLEIGFGLTIIAMLLISPLGWNYYFPLLIIPLLTLLKIAKFHRYGSIIILLSSVALLLSSIPSQLLEPIQIYQPVVILFGSSYYCYALLLLMIALLLANTNPTAAGITYYPQLPARLVNSIFIVALMPSIIGNYATIINTEKYLHSAHNDISIMGCVKSRKN